MKKLTEEQIDKLFVFTKKHLVEHYDVQVELVDHLANAIEAEWETNPNISFEDVLQKEYKNFGIFGFSGLLDQKQAALQEYYWGIIKKEFVSFFSIPKILLSGGLFYVLFLLISNPSPWFVANDYIFTLVLSVIIFGMYFYLKIRMKTDKKWLIQNTANYLFSLPFTLIVLFNSSLGFNNIVQQPSLFRILLNTISVELYLLFLIILYFKIVPLLVQEIKQTELRFHKM